MLRGPQTVGELRIHSERLHRFADISSVEAFLHELAERKTGSLVVELPRQPGARNALGASVVRTARRACRGAASRDRRLERVTIGELAAIKANVTQLQLELATLKTTAERLMKELGLPLCSESRRGRHGFRQHVRNSETSGDRLCAQSRGRDRSLHHRPLADRHPPATLITKALERQKVEPTIVCYMGNTISVALNVLLVIGILGYFGVETTSFAALIAALGIAIGAAWGGLLSNLAAGVFILVLRPFKVGDYVLAAEVEGTVRAIGIFTTAIDAPDNVNTTVGNAKVMNGTIKNFSHNPFRRVDLTAQLDHTVDPQDAIRRLKETLPTIANVVKAPAPDVEIITFNERGPVLAVRPYVHTDHLLGKCTSIPTRRFARRSAPPAIPRPKRTCSCARRRRDDRCPPPPGGGHRCIRCREATMGLLDGLLGNLMGGMTRGDQQAQGGNPLLLIALQMLQQNGGIQGLPTRMQQAGMGAQAQSWIGTGKPADFLDALSQILGHGQLGQIAQQLGMSQQDVAGGLAQTLPRGCRRDDAARADSRQP